MTATHDHPAVRLDDPQPTETETETGTEPESRPPWRALPVVLLGSGLSTASFFVVNVALPTIGRQLSADSAQLSLVVAAYSAAYAALLVAGGRLGDRFGRRRMFTIGAAAFAGASALCALAVDGWTLVGARLVQGLAAAMLAPQVLSTIQAVFTGRDRQRAIAYFGAMAGLAAVLGQMLGGVAAELDLAGLGWRALFLLLVPLAGTTAVLAHLVVPETRGERLRIDLIGAGLLTLTLVLLLLPLSLGANLGWPPWTWVALAAVIPSAWAFVVVERRIERAGRAPLLPPSLFALPPFRRGLLVALLFFVGMGGFFLAVGITMQSGLGLTPFGTALVLTPYAVGFLLCSLLTPRLVQRYGGRVMASGAGLLALTYAGIAVQAGLDYAHLTGAALAPTLAVVGFGQGLVMVPVFGQVLAQLPADRAGVASGVLTTTQQAGIAIGAAAFGALLFAFPEGPAHSAGWEHATVSVFAAETVLCVLTSVYAHRVAVRPTPS